MPIRAFVNCYAKIFFSERSKWRLVTPSGRSDGVPSARFSSTEATVGTYLHANHRAGICYRYRLE